VPEECKHDVPEKPGVYAIYNASEPPEQIISRLVDIGECGFRPKSTHHGLKGRLATGVAHSASKKMARDIQAKLLSPNLRVVWYKAESKAEAKDMQDALIVLFSQEFGKQPRYNTKRERHDNPEIYKTIFDALKESITGDGNGKV